MVALAMKYKAVKEEGGSQCRHHRVPRGRRWGRERERKGMKAKFGLVNPSLAGDLFIHMNPCINHIHLAHAGITSMKVDAFHM